MGGIPHICPLAPLALPQWVCPVTPCLPPHMPLCTLQRVPLLSLPPSPVMPHCSKVEVSRIPHRLTTQGLPEPLHSRQVGGQGLWGVLPLLLLLPLLVGEEGEEGGRGG